VEHNIIITILIGFAFAKLKIAFDYHPPFSFSTDFSNFIFKLPPFFSHSQPFRIII
jgi:hypothetical protein